MNPKKKTLQATSSYYTTVSTPHTSSEQLREYVFSTISSSTSIYDTTPRMPFPESTVNVTYINNDTATTAESPLWHNDSTDAGATIPGTIDDVITPTGTIYFDDVTMPSGTMPYNEVTGISSGDFTVTSGTIFSGDEVTVSYDTVAVVSDTVVLDDGLSVVIPTINSDDFTASPWQDLPEYIPVSVEVPRTTSDPAAASPPTTTTHTTEKPVIITTASAMTPLRRTEETSESNAINIAYNRIIGMDNDISQNNLISRHRINLRERTKNKRIQELLEEKRNFLLRMKRGHAAR